MTCANELEDGRPCGDEGEVCEACSVAETEKWARYFGLRSGMGREAYRRQLEAFRPLGVEPRAEE